MPSRLGSGSWGVPGCWTNRAVPPARISDATADFQGEVGKDCNARNTFARIGRAAAAQETGLLLPRCQNRAINSGKAHE